LVTPTRVFTSLPEFLVFDVEFEGVRRRNRCSLVPIDFWVLELAATGRSRRLMYSVSAFIEVVGSHARSFVRVGPAHFKVYTIRLWNGRGFSRDRDSSGGT
jgi:hypothetical protein